MAAQRALMCIALAEDAIETEAPDSMIEPPSGAVRAKFSGC